MGFTLITRPRRTILACLLIGAGAWGCYALGQHWLPVMLWILGHLLVWLTIGRIDQPTSVTGTMASISSSLLAGSSLLVLLWATQWTTTPAFGWGSFVHLNDLPYRVWGHILGLIPLTIGCWLFSLRQIRRLQSLRPQRGPRFALLLGTSFALALMNFLPFFEISFLLLLFSLVIYLFSLDLYLEDKRTSMTWLLVWLLLMSLLVSTFIGRPSDDFRPPIALISVFFLAALVYCLLLRGACWLLAFPFQRWLVPTFGPRSIKIRIQISFFVLALLAMGLVSGFTMNFFQRQPALLNLWLENLLSVYVFLLLIVGTLGIFFANSISDPIIRISEKIGDTRLQNNVPLNWPREDEIGKLVASYNQMIVELDQSAAQLATTEREGAWREMAKQVAHEIKNPLTPMKLQLQQLLRLEKEDSERAREWSQRISRSIIEQIDGLALIATEFSSFARLPEAKAVTFDLRKLVQSAYDLHSAGKPEGQLRLSLPDTATPVHADRDQLLRVLNNLIRNADQALQGQENARIAISLETKVDLHSLIVKDNGPGIPPEVQPKIFQPNFTTKSSGMGLGLAMCKAIVEQAGGSIGFKTNTGDGTTFEVNLPIVI